MQIIRFFLFLNGAESSLSSDGKGQKVCVAHGLFLQGPRGERQGNARGTIPKGMPEALSCDINLRSAKKSQIKHPICKGPAASVRGMPEAQSRRECQRHNPVGNASGQIPIGNSEDPLLWGFGKLSARICEVLPGHDQRPLPAGVHISAKQYRQRKSTILWAFPGL